MPRSKPSSTTYARTAKAMIPAQMNSRVSQSMPLLPCRWMVAMEARRRCDPGRARRPKLVHPIAGLGRAVHQAKDVPGADAENDEIDDDEGNQGGFDRCRVDGRCRIHRAKVAVDHIGLAADFGGDPARDHGDKPCRP